MPFAAEPPRGTALHFVSCGSENLQETISRTGVAASADWNIVLGIQKVFICVQIG